VVDGPYVYVAAGQTGMDIIDSSPAPPVRVEGYATSGPAKGFTRV
jgi:hypothetical protein